MSNLPYHNKDLDFHPHDRFDEGNLTCDTCGKPIPPEHVEHTEGLCLDCAAWTGVDGYEYEDDDETEEEE